MPVWEKLPRFTRGPKKARDALNGIANRVEWLIGFTVGTGTGLQMEESASGRKLTFVPTPDMYYVTVSAEAAGFGSTAAGGANKYGKGTGTLDRETYDPTSGVCTRVVTTKSVTFHNPGKDPIPVGARIQVKEKAPGRWHAISHLCT